MTAAEFVDKLNQNAGGALDATERAQLIDELGQTPNDAQKRASVLRKVADDQTLRDAEFRKAFVLMQYFGYLRRDPDAAPDTSFEGYNFWLGKLNEFNGDYIRAELVRGLHRVRRVQEEVRAVTTRRLENEGPPRAVNPGGPSLPDCVAGIASAAL